MEVRRHCRDEERLWRREDDVEMKRCYADEEWVMEMRRDYRFEEVLEMSQGYRNKMRRFCRDEERLQRWCVIEIRKGYGDEKVL